MTDHLKSLRAKIIAAVPEIVELKEGCKLKHNQRGIGIFAYWSIGEGLELNVINAVFRPIMGRGRIFAFSQFCKEYEIIGRPITLEDVIIAIQKLNPDYPIHIDFYFEKEGKITFTQAKGHPIINKEADWLLGKPLDQQPPETIKFLDELIPKENKDDNKKR